MKNKGFTFVAICCFILSFGLAYYLVSHEAPEFSIVKFLLYGCCGWFVFSFVSWMGIVLSSNTIEGAQPAVQSSVQYYYNDYSAGFCRVEKIIVNELGEVRSEFNFLDESGNYISEKWYAAVSDFNDDGVALVFDGQMYNFIDKTGKLVSINWFYGIEGFSDGKAKVYWKDHTVNFVNLEGKTIWPDWRPEIVLNKNNNTENTEEDNND